MSKIVLKKEIVATPNYSKRTFTIRCKEGGVTYTKYRTLPMGKVEFEETEANMTQGEWEAWFSYANGSYYKVK